MAVSVLTDAILKDYIQKDSTSLQKTVTDAMITRAVNAANDTLEEWGLADSETGNAAVHAGALLGMSNVSLSVMINAALRGEEKVASVLEKASETLYNQAVKQAALFLSPSLRKSRVRANRSWAWRRGGALYRGSEAGRYARTGSDA